MPDHRGGYPSGSPMGRMQKLPTGPAAGARHKPEERYGLAITPEQRSEARVAAVRFEVGKALLRVHSDYPDLTYEEILDGLLIIAGRQVQHLRTEPMTQVGQPLLRPPDPVPKED